MLKASRGHWLGFMTRHADLLGLGTSSRAQGLVLQDFCQDFLLARIEGDCLMLCLGM